MGCGTKPDEKMCEVGRRLKKCRKFRGLTREDLSEAVSKLLDDGENTISVKQIGYIECGKRALSPKYLLLLSRALNVRKEYLALEDPYMTEQERFNSALDNMETSARIMHSVIQLAANSQGYEIESVDNRIDKDQSIIIEPSCFYYVVKQNNLVIAHCSIEEYTELRNEIFHYTSYLLEKIIEKQKKKLCEPYAMEPEGGWLTNG